MEIVKKIFQAKIAFNYKKCFLIYNKVGFSARKTSMVDIHGMWHYTDAKSVLSQFGQKIN